ncbi:MAG: sulfotransferase family protein [Dermatophilaceae bacterium]
MTTVRSTDRLVRSPAFVLSSTRSGSTLLGRLLNSHPQICAPHELHVAELAVELPTRYVRLAMDVAGLDRDDLNHLLWDRVLHQQLTASGKDVIVDKTPSNVLIWRRIDACWPDARYVFLLRHPARILDSTLRVRAPDKTVDEVQAVVEDFLGAMQDAMAHLDGLTVRYEDLTRDPVAVTRQVCEFAGVEWEPAMLDYGAHDYGPFLAGIGDFTVEIRSSRVIPEPATPNACDLPEALLPAAHAWGYIGAHR